MSFLTATFLPAVLAAFLALVVQQMVGPAFLAFRDGKRLAAALAAEIEALLTLAREQDIVRVLPDQADLMASLHGANDSATLDHLTYLSVSFNFFEVYSANVARLGLLDDLAPDVVTLYTRLKAFLEGMKVFEGFYRDLVEGRYQQLSADAMRDRYTTAADLLAHCAEHRAALAQALRHFSQRRFCGVIR